MTFQIRTIICTVAALTTLLATSCADDDAPRATVQMPVSLVLPAEAIETRTLPGDPGTWEEFNEPKHLYLFVVLQGNLDGAANAVGIFQEYQPLNGSWVKTAVNGNSVYKYAGNIQVNIPEGDRTQGAVYAATSFTALTLNNTPTNEGSYASWDDAIDAVKNITFTPADYNNLQDIYSSPYNLKIDDDNNQLTPDNYYGTVQDVASAQPNVDNLMLFHVAAKVDLIWNVADDVQSDIRLTDNITVKGLRRTGYLFRPNENRVPTNDAATYTRAIPINIGNQWDGRAYFYAIPYSEEGKYPITLTITKKSATDEIATKEVALNIPYTPTETENPYTHWMRGDIRINSWN